MNNNNILANLLEKMSQDAALTHKMCSMDTDELAAYFYDQGIPQAECVKLAEQAVEEFKIRFHSLEDEDAESVSGGYGREIVDSSSTGMFI